jgi:hypothetical protein
MREGEYQKQVSADPNWPYSGFVLLQPRLRKQWSLSPGPETFPRSWQCNDIDYSSALPVFLETQERGSGLTLRLD